MSDKLRVRDVMTEDVFAVGPDTSVARAAEQMIANGIRALPVTNENGEVLGIITDRRVMDHFLPAITALAEGEVEERVEVMPQLESSTVRDVMRRTVMCVREEQTLDEVAALMINKDIERFMVAAEGKLTGFITRGDILRRLVPPEHAPEKAEMGQEQNGEEAKGQEANEHGQAADENLEIRWEPEDSDGT
jgi:CBS domain-containing protein